MIDLKAAYTGPYGRIAGSTGDLEMPDGETIRVPMPLINVHSDVAVSPGIDVIPGERAARLDFDRWSLVDLHTSFVVGLSMSGRPDSDPLSRLVSRYVDEARDLPPHELRQWVERVVGGD